MFYSGEALTQMYNGCLAMFLQKDINNQPGEKPKIPKVKKKSRSARISSWFSKKISGQPRTTDVEDVVAPEIGTEYSDDTNKKVVVT